LIIFSSGIAYTQTKNDSYDEISVLLNVPRVGNWEMGALIKGQEAYLPLKDFFEVLQIRNSSPENSDTIEGFFIYPNAKYLIDKTNDRIVYQNKIFPLKPNNLIRWENNLYLKSANFGEIFGLDCIFNFRSLSITVNTKLELPAIREMQLQQMRKNISQLKGEKKADTTIKRKFSMFHLGMADWSVLNY